MYLYKTLYSYGEAEYVIDRSRFIARALPVSSYEEAQEYVAKIKSEFKDATHNVPAIVFGMKQEHKWASDDGEPSGTSGFPVMNMLADEGLTNLVVVITRYFGGIKLGTGGLVRAYTQAAKLAVEEAGICDVYEAVSFTCVVDYTYLAKIQNIAKDGHFEILNIEYSDKVKLEIGCMIEEEEKVITEIMDISGGNVLTSDRKECNIRKLV